MGVHCSSLYQLKNIFKVKDVSRDAYNQQNNNWRGSDKKYTASDGCKWLTGQQEIVSRLVSLGVEYL